MYAQLTLDVTPERVGRMAKRLGVQTELRVDGAYVPSMGLGSIAVSPLDMASGYATLAAGGVACEPMAIRRVVLPGGKVDDSADWGKKRCTRVLSRGEAYVVTDILEQNVQYGTGTGASYGHPAAGKTGTTDDHADAWFAGYTPRLQTTVWVGYPKGEIPMENVHGISVSGGSFPAQIWRLFMSAAIGHLEPLEFEDPGDEPEWSTLEQGQYARSFGYYDDDDDYVAPATTETTETPTAPAHDDTAARRAEAAASPAAGRRRLHRLRPRSTPPPPPPVEPPPPPPTEPVTP